MEEPSNQTSSPRTSQNLTFSESWNLDALCLGVEVLVAEAGVFALVGGGAKGEGLHAVVVEGADGVDVGAGSELLELFLGVIELEDLLHAVEVLAHVVLVGVHAESLVNLPLHLNIL